MNAGEPQKKNAININPNANMCIRNELKADESKDLLVPQRNLQLNKQLREQTKLATSVCVDPRLANKQLDISRNPFPEAVAALPANTNSATTQANQNLQQPPNLRPNDQQPIQSLDGLALVLNTDVRVVRVDSQTDTSNFFELQGIKRKLYDIVKGRFCCSPSRESYNVETFTGLLGFVFFWAIVYCYSYDSSITYFVALVVVGGLYYYAEAFFYCTLPKHLSDEQRLNSKSFEEYLTAFCTAEPEVLIQTSVQDEENQDQKCCCCKIEDDDDDEKETNSQKNTAQIQNTQQGRKRRESAKLSYLVCYDITDDTKIRTLLSKKKSYRVQFSVCWEPGDEAMRTRIENLRAEQKKKVGKYSSTMAFTESIQLPDCKQNYQHPYLVVPGGSCFYHYCTYLIFSLFGLSIVYRELFLYCVDTIHFPIHKVLLAYPQA